MKELLTSGVELMLVGMGIVYLFLALLVGMVNTLAWLIQRYFTEPMAGKTTRGQAPREAAAPEESDLVATIAAAIHAFRVKH